MIFQDLLKEMAARTDGVLGGVVMGMDGIAVGELILDPDFSIQSAGVEYASAIRSIQKASLSLDAGPVQEVSIRTSGTVFLLRILNPDYFVALALRPEANLGKARYLLRLGAPRLAGELE